MDCSCLVPLDWFLYLVSTLKLILIICFFLFVSGNEVHIAVNTDTEYEKRDKNNHFGVKCKVIGYEYSDDIKEVGIELLFTSALPAHIIVCSLCSSWRRN